MATDPRFPELVSLACHDLRTPLATVAGFAATLLRAGGLDEKSQRYVTLMEAAALQLGEIIDDVAVTARIEAGRYEPTLETVDSLELAREAVSALGPDRVDVDGTGAPTTVDAPSVRRALARLANAALRHGGLEGIRLHVDGTTLRLAPITADAAPVLLGVELRDLGAATARSVIEALHGSLALEGEELVVRLPG